MHYRGTEARLLPNVISWEISNLDSVRLYKSVE